MNIIIQGLFPGGKPHNAVLTGMRESLPANNTLQFIRNKNVHRPPVIQKRKPASNVYQLDSSKINLKDNGISLPPGVKEKMESIFKTDFSNVKIHTGPQAESIGALAFTTGNDIYFAQGQYNPNSSHGQRLIGHELTHVVQQKKGRVRNPLGSGVAVVHDPGLEAEAERMGIRVSAGNYIVQAKLSSLKSYSFSAPVIQCLWRYKSTVVKKDYIIAPSQGTKGKRYLRMASYDEPKEELAYMQYSFDEKNKIVYMEHIEAYGMPEGTRAAYLLFYRMTLDALDSGMEKLAIGTGVDERSAKRNLVMAEESKDQKKIKEAKMNLAAVHIYGQLGFDAADAVKLSNSVRTLAHVRDTSRQKADPYWLKWIGPQKNSGCFLTTACTAVQGLPDDCMELKVLRHFRDNYMMRRDDLKALVIVYYEIAPLIVDEILSDENCYKELKNIYGIIKKCVRLIKLKKYAQALKQYKAMVEKLSITYLGTEIKLDQPQLK